MMRWYRLLLRVCAPALGRQFGAAMEDTFVRRLADARQRGRWRAARVWLREVVGVCLLAVPHRSVRPSAFTPVADKAGTMDLLGQELRYAARRLLHTPTFSLAAVLTLALAIAANTAIFAVVQRVIVNPLPYPDSDRLVFLEHGSVGLNAPSGLEMTPGLYFHYTERARTLEAAALHRREEATLTGTGDPERVRVARATPSLTTVLRVAPVSGRWFQEADAVPGATPVALLSHSLWQRRYSRNPGILGQLIQLEGVPTEVIGVMPAAFAFPDPQTEIWLPVRVTRAMGFGLWEYGGVARLRDGASIDDLRAEVNALIPDLPRAFPGDIGAAGNVQTKLFSVARTLKETMVGGIARALWMLLAAAGLLLLVACANIANLFLVRSDARQRDIAVRRALGAGRLNIARFFLTESALLSIAGGVLGVALAAGALRALVAFGPATLPRLHEIHLDGAIVAFAFALSVIAAAGFGAIPIVRGASVAAALREQSRGGTSSRHRHYVRHVLMGMQVALALVLLVSSGLMARSFQKLRAVDPGFDATSSLTFSIGLPEREYVTQAAAIDAHQRIIDALTALPGVKGVSATSCLPISGACFGNTVRVEGRVLPPGAVPQIAAFRAVAADYFETAGTRLLRGRTLTRDDIDRGNPVIVVSDTLARRFFPDEDPIGRRVASNKRAADELRWLEIVGVVADTSTGRALPGGPPLPQLYMPMSIAGGPGISKLALVGPDVAVMSYVVRTATPPLEMVGAARAAIATVDGKLAVAQIRTLQDLLDRASGQMAFTMFLLAIAAAVALLLGLVGIYGVMSYIVSQRTSEIGVRLALGAEPASVSGAIVRQGGAVTIAGLAAGLGVALAGSRAIEALLYGISPRDPLVFTATTIALFVVALFACWLPARRAARLSPVEALRSD